MTNYKSSTNDRKKKGAMGMDGKEIDAIAIEKGK